MNVNCQPANVFAEPRFWSSAPGRIRTRDPLLRRQLLCPAELQALRLIVHVAADLVGGNSGSAPRTRAPGTRVGSRDAAPATEGVAVRPPRQVRQ